MSANVPLPPKNEPKLTPAQKQRQRFKVIRDLHRDAKAGDKTVWSRLGDADKVHVYWKGLMRDHLKKKQEPRCCYCKRWLLNYAYASPIEHVLPRSIYPEHALRLKNLALACYDCNHLKDADDWGKVVGPFQTRDAVGFFHPRIHSYEEHIHYLHYETNDLEYISFHGLTPQGRHLCTRLLSDVVGKKRLEGSFPGLQLWVKATRSLDNNSSRSSSDRPELDIFGRMLSRTVSDQLDDGAKISAMWIRK